jgi:hypothetical protein
VVEALDDGFEFGLENLHVCGHETVVRLKQCVLSATLRLQDPGKWRILTG